MRVKDVAERLDVSADTVYALVSSGKLRCHRVGLGRGSIRVSEDHLAEYLSGTEQGPTPAPRPVPRAVKSRYFRRP